MPTLDELKFLQALPLELKIAKTKARIKEWVDNPYYEPCAPEYDPVDGWKNWNPKKIWQPTANGLGMKFVFDEVNAIYGKDYIKYQ